MTLSSPGQRSRYGVATRSGSLAARDPVQQVDNLYALMNELFADVLPELVGPGIIPADIEETEDSYIVEVELPGVAPGDLDISLRDTELRVTGEVKERERTGVLRRRTRRIGRFDLAVALPGPVDQDRVEAELRDGVLMVRLHKPEGSRDRHIEVRSA
jgi:HSP20 family protein